MLNQTVYYYGIETTKNTTHNVHTQSLGNPKDHHGKSNCNSIPYHIVMFITSVLHAEH